MNSPRPIPTGHLRRAFTLLEVVIAIAILGMLSITLYRFVDTTLRAAAFSEKSGQEDDALAGLRRLVAAQLAAIPVNMNDTLIGMAVLPKAGVHRDEMQFVCPAGNALLTPDAPGLYEATLGLNELPPKGSGHFALYLERSPWTGDADEREVDQKTAGPLQPLRLKPVDALKLMDGVRALEISYFDARLNGWMDRWTDSRTLPNLVRLRLTTEMRPEPFEMVLRVPGGGLTQLDGQLNVPGVSAGNAVVLPNGQPAAPPSYVPPSPPSFVPQPPPTGVPQPPPNGFRQPPPNFRPSSP